MKNKSYKEDMTPTLEKIIPQLQWNKTIVDKLENYSTEEVEALFRIACLIVSNQEYKPEDVIIHQDIISDIIPQYKKIIKECYLKILEYPEKRKKSIILLRVNAKKEHIFIVESRDKKSYYGEWLKRRKNESI